MRLHEQIASTDYWAEPLRLPSVPIGAELIDGFCSVHHLASRGAAKVIILYEKARRSGHIAEAVAPGRELPLIERGEGLLRVVEDTINAGGPSAISSMLGLKFNDAETFDRLATQIQANRLYNGESARMLTTDEYGRLVRIWRTVSYMTGSKSGHMLDGVISSQLGLRPNQIPILNQLPPLVVGEAYIRKGRGRSISKVIAADILIPGGGKKKRLPKRASARTSARLVASF